MSPPLTALHGAARHRSGKTILRSAMVHLPAGRRSKGRCPPPEALQTKDGGGVWGTSSAVQSIYEATVLGIPASKHCIQPLVMGGARLPISSIPGLQPRSPTSSYTPAAGMKEPEHQKSTTHTLKRRHLSFVQCVPHLTHLVCSESEVHLANGLS